MEPKIISLKEIKKIISSLDLIPAIEQGFTAYSSGRAVVPPVGELLLDKGEVHLKYGYIQDEEFYVIKIATGFYDNPALGLSSGNGLMLLFNQHTGGLVSILLDEGFLTDTRTAIAGAIAAKYLAPKHVERIGIVGTGTQARLQLASLKDVITCDKVLVWGRSKKKLVKYQNDMKENGFQIETTTDVSNILSSCNLVVTTTPTTAPLLFSSELQSGTHITAVGSDTQGKQELESAILGRADLVVADSVSQCLLRGEISNAIKTGHIIESGIVELGNIVGGKKQGRNNETQITVADLTGVAVQDMKIAAAVYKGSNLNMS